MPYDPKTLTLTDVLRFHDRKSEEARGRSLDARCSSWTKRQWKMKQDLHEQLADVVRCAIVRIQDGTPVPGIPTKRDAVYWLGIVKRLDDAIVDAEGVDIDFYLPFTPNMDDLREILKQAKELPPT